MRSFKIAVLACITLLLGHSEGRAQRITAGSWALLHTTEVSNEAATKIIPLPAAVRSKAIRLHLKSGGLALKRVRVMYGAGQVHFEDRTISLVAGERTKPIDAREEERIVGSIALSIDQTKSAANSTLEVWVLTLESPAQRPPASTAATSSKSNPSSAAKGGGGPGASPVTVSPTTGPIAATPTAPVPATAAPGSQLPGGAVLFGVQNVGFLRDRDAIRVGANLGQFDRIQLRVLDNDVFINEIDVVYVDGTSTRLVVNADIKQNTRTRWLDTNGTKFIKEINMNYRSRPSLKGQARMEVYGQISEGWLGPNGRGRQFNEGWVLLGAQSAGRFLRTEVDRIEVGRNEGSFRRIRVTVKERALVFDELRVIYGNGEEEVIRVNATIAANSTFGPVDLKDGNRVIREIRARYRSAIYDAKAVGRSAAIVEIWAQNGGGSSASSPSKEPSQHSSPVAPALPSKSDEPFARVPILFGTNRQREEPILKNNRRIAVFSGLQGNGLTLGRAVVTVPTPKDPEKRRAPGTVSRPMAFTIVGFRVAMRPEDPTRDFTIESVDVQDPASFSGALKLEMSKAKAFGGQAFVFVHGFNVSFDDALFRAAQISHDIGFDGASLVFSWPSKGGLLEYAYDQRQAREAQEPLREFIELVSREQGITKLNFIAHSMGNDPLLEVLSSIAAAGRRPGEPKINEVILAAPDVPVSTFRRLTTRIVPLVSGGLTLYASSTDKALIASRQVDSTLKAGFVTSSSPTIVEGVQSIDVSKASTGFFSLNHSSFADRRHVLMDIGMILKTGTRPPEVRAPAIWEKVERGKYWRYAPN